MNIGCEVRPKDVDDRSRGSNAPVAAAGGLDENGLRRLMASGLYMTVLWKVGGYVLDIYGCLVLSCCVLCFTLRPCCTLVQVYSTMLY